MNCFSDRIKSFSLLPEPFSLMKGHNNFRNKIPFIRLSQQEIPSYLSFYLKLWKLGSDFPDFLILLISVNSILQENNKMSIEELEEQIEEEWVKVRIYLIDRLFKVTTIKNLILRL